MIQYGFNYIGDLKDGKRHGNGKYIYPNGDTYEGEWNCSIREGEGTFTYKDDSHTYVGNFLANVFHGWGTLHIIGGEKYEGEWSNGKMEGEGTTNTHSGILILVSGRTIREWTRDVYLSIWEKI